MKFEWEYVDDIFVPVEKSMNKKAYIIVEDDDAGAEVLPAIIKKQLKFGSYIVKDEEDGDSYLLPMRDVFTRKKDAQKIVNRSKKGKK